MTQRFNFDRYLSSSTSAEEAAGQLFIFGFDGVRYDRRLRSFFQRTLPGGVILFSRNIQNGPQTKALIGDLQKLSLDLTGIPLFVCIDQEGGRVSRLSGDLPTFPTGKSLGDDGSVELVETTYAAIGKTVADLGFNIDFAPVLDLLTNHNSPVIGDRAFSSDADKVATLGKAAIRGLRSSRIMGCAKHFPGHGDTDLDSHLALPTDSRPAGRFRDHELVPFIAAIEEKVDFIMTAHVIYSGIDPRHPATLSRPIVTDILRNELSYQGVIVGDDLDMAAVAARYDDKEAVRLALEAGVDALLVCHDTPRRDNAWEAAREVIDRGSFPDKTNTISHRLKRLIKAKQKLRLPE
jgi:beta-N-acetylhexosaminidase